MEKIIWVLMIGMSLFVSYIHLEPTLFSIVLFILFLFVSTVLFLRFDEDHWLDRVSPLVGIGVGALSLIAYIGLIVLSFNEIDQLGMWTVLVRLMLMYVGIYLFVVTTSSFLAGATRLKPSRFFRPVLIFSVFFYGAMLLIPLQPGL
ncbi:MAG: hypothetical protein WBV10_12095 [Exiguobacterium marinum]|uniref:Uncharacterized protein n=1 Tax=Exiguobacterium marinum TaxID=273528 RepID=A0ABY7X0W0_9BACL|nr:MULTISPECIES: hypothetical protein [Exiguobacterium]WDH76767.1 hypothetical protein PTI97_04430 [Exiguobacterium marinum]